MRVCDVPPVPGEDGCMSRKGPVHDIDESELEVGGEAHAAAGITAVGVAMKRAVDAMGVRRTAKTLLKLNQTDGFDCQGCAWPDPEPGHRHTAEFCENGAKAVAEEATRTMLDRGVLRDPLAGRPRGQDGVLARQAGPADRADGASRGRHALRADRLGRRLLDDRRPPDRLDHPDEAVFYTSGKTSNEAAFVYQLFVRSFGTNNLPDCSNMCHESSGAALSETIGIGKGSVSLDDIHRAKLIVVVGQNPGTNHPRMLSALEEAKHNGAKIISVNPLEEAGLVRFKNPQHAKGHGARHRALRPAPAGPAQRRPRALPGDRLAARRVGRPRPRLPRHPHRRLRGVRRPPQGPRLGQGGARPPA